MWSKFGGWRLYYKVVEVSGVVTHTLLIVQLGFASLNKKYPNPIVVVTMCLLLISMHAIFNVGHVVHIIYLAMNLVVTGKSY